MSKWYPCVYCTEDMQCTKYSGDGVISYCVEAPCSDQRKSNADRIRSMTNEELARFISGKARGFGEEYEGYMSALDWLKEEAADG